MSGMKILKYFLEELYQERTHSLISTIRIPHIIKAMVTKGGSGPVTAKLIKRKAIAIVFFGGSQSILLIDFLEGQGMIPSTYQKSVLRKLSKALAKIVQDNFSRESFSTITMLLLFSFLKQGQFCKSFNGKSLDVHLIFLIWTLLSFFVFPN